MKSNIDRNWTEENKAAALSEGWELALVVDEGKSVSAAYLDIFDRGPVFRNRQHAQRFVIAKAQTNSRLHIHALSTCRASRMVPPVPPRKKR